ncbi:MAG: [FeFe] hydrogenase H-cluster maturation GTPase HydF [Treponema sp.]|nr:[FeFe] hydrogenase H-cluster maturation GTPase HydF [Treponema sp.]MCL2272342.1 [FeFe] hydrogenase H-cluster maturation GTPase HydF [Treponema sp.]
MDLNQTHSSDRVQIAFFGRRNAGKSSLVNAVTAQKLAIVSSIKGTTTDPVLKSMELLPVGPVVIIDTPGFDDEGMLGEQRVKKARQILNKTDVAILVLDGEIHSDFEPETRLIDLFRERNVPYLIARNKTDIFPDERKLPDFFTDVLSVSAKTGVNVNLLKERIASLAVKDESDKKLISDLVSPNDFIVLVIPIDKAAPKGRIILAQQQVLRDALDSGCVVIAVRETELEETLSGLGKKPALVITDSQVFGRVSQIVPEDMPLTSFSIIFARYRGFLKSAVNGVEAIDELKDGSKVLVCEGCTHHRQCDDIGTVKLPCWIEEHISRKPVFEFCSGGDFPEDVSRYSIIIHCGGCMLNQREMSYRKYHAEKNNIPFTNYGITIAHIKGILKRSIEVFKK